ncbi:hypothetical protein HZH66_008696 [Vespula vulgaris]|uniref:Uncharacterized protein n=1 Tax=Vespula vulgaris TaxID=7454 RepID=A0A834JQ01_VESVU|nr:hypothetical protein HZH66_008696 [Vespula vulgaris]
MTSEPSITENGRSWTASHGIGRSSTGNETIPKDDATTSYVSGRDSSLLAKIKEWKGEKDRMMETFVDTAWSTFDPPQDGSSLAPGTGGSPTRHRVERPLIIFTTLLTRHPVLSGPPEKTAF